MEYAFAALPIVILLVGAGMIWFARQSQLRRRAAQSWPTVPGKILVSRAYEERIREKDGSYSSKYRRSVEYEFVVGDTTIQSRRIDMAGDPIYYIKSSCEKAVAAYPVGATVSVHYHPAKPDDCALDVTRGDSIQFYLFGGFFILVGAALLYVALIGGFGGGDLSQVLTNP